MTDPQVALLMLGLFIFILFFIKGPVGKKYKWNRAAYAGKLHPFGRAVHGPFGFIAI